MYQSIIKSSNNNNNNNNNNNQPTASNHHTHAALSTQWQSTFDDGTDVAAGGFLSLKDCVHAADEPPKNICPGISPSTILRGLSLSVLAFFFTLPPRNSAAMGIAG